MARKQPLRPMGERLNRPHAEELTLPAGRGERLEASHVGYSRFAHVNMPISGKPEIGCRPHPSRRVHAKARTLLRMRPEQRMRTPDGLGGPYSPCPVVVGVTSKAKRKRGRSSPGWSSAKVSCGSR